MASELIIELASLAVAAGTIIWKSGRAQAAMEVTLAEQVEHYKQMDAERTKQSELRDTRLREIQDKIWAELSANSREHSQFAQAMERITGKLDGLSSLETERHRSLDIDIDEVRGDSARHGREINDLRVSLAAKHGD